MHKVSNPKQLGHCLAVMVSSYLKQLKNIIKCIKNKQLVINDLEYEDKSPWGSKKKRTFSFFLKKKSTGLSQAIELLLSDHSNYLSIAFMDFDFDAMDTLLNSKQWHKFSRLFFPIEHPCMPVHFEETFLWWLEHLYKPISKQEVQHKLILLADYLHNKDMYASNVQLLENAKKAKIHCLPKELRQRVYSFILHDPRTTW